MNLYQNIYFCLEMKKIKIELLKMFLSYHIVGNLKTIV